MKQIFMRLMSILLALLMVLLPVPQAASAVCFDKWDTCNDSSHSDGFYLPQAEATEQQTPAISNNVNDYDYINAYRWTTPIYSHLVFENGEYVRVESIGSNLVVEYYDEQFRFESRQDIPLELPIFGGAYLCEDYNFVVVGQNNEQEDDNVEVIRIIRYAKDWTRVDSVSLYGANTVSPFAGGSLRFARFENRLFVRTCHRMYASLDGLNHQANMTVCVDISNMEITASYPWVENYPFGYVSHSFNQFILVDGEDILMLDHGDAYPRSLVMFRNQLYNGMPNYWRPEEIDVFHIGESIDHYNDTGVAVGGFEYSDTHYLVAANSTSQDGGIDFARAQRNIFIASTPKNDFSESATTITWITDYNGDAGVKLGTPQLTKLNDGRLFLMWAVDGKINCCYITADGKLDGDVFEVEGYLSDCLPIQRGNYLIWYVTNNSAPVFYSIDLSNPGTVTVPHSHTYDMSVVSPTCEGEGSTVYTCAECGHTYTEPLAPSGHRWGGWFITVMPTQTTEGQQCSDCIACGKRETRVMPAVNSFDELESEHDYGNYESRTWVYTLAGADMLLITFDDRTFFEYSYDYLHVYDMHDNLVGSYTGSELAGVTISVNGNTVKLQLTSDSSQAAWGFKVTEISSAHLHQWSPWKMTIAPTEVQEGEKYRTCLTCDESETQTIPVIHAISQLQSEHNYADQVDQTWFYCVADAIQLLVTFDGQSYLENGWDWLYIYDMDDNLLGAYTGDDLAGRTILVPGQAVKLQLVSDISNHYWGFRVTDVTPVFRQPHTHSYVSAMLKAPNCETDGVRVYTCSICGDMYSEKIPTSGHMEVTDTAVAPTCTLPGLSEGKHCAVCGTVLVAQEVVAATGHSYDTETIEPTCTEPGSVVYTCHCGDTYTETIPSPGHQYTSVVTAPTCTEAGFTTYTCHCGDSYIADAVPALGHDEVVDAALAPTCTETGMTEGKHCARCNEVLIAQTVLAALGHDEVTDAAVAPTCTETGLTEGIHCAVCGQTLVAQETLAALGHDYDLTDSKAPTCTEDGYQTYVCQHGCGDSYTETVGAAGHAYSAVVTEPTCTQDGCTTHTCANCGDQYTTDVVAAYGHSFKEGICQRCGAPEVEPGDANGDGKVNARDARLILRYAASLIDPDEINLVAGDYNGDGKVNARDARAILRAAAGLG